MNHDETQIAARAAYIQKWDGHLDAYFADRLDVAGKRLFVLGSGWGSEVLWALRRGAAEVVGVDPRSADRGPLERALDEQGLGHLKACFSLHEGTTPTVGDIGGFDAAMSNNVLEHVADLSANLAALARLIPGRDARFVAFADPLYLSSLGHHLPIGPWEHLSLAQADIRAKVGPLQWRDYREGLNGMTITSFLAAVREAGMVLLEMSVRPDPNLARFPELALSLPPAHKPMDLCLSGFGCTLAFPHNL